MAEYIERDTILKYSEEMAILASHRVLDTPTNSPAYMRYVTQSQERKEFVSLLKNAPAADVVEVVRCRDCCYWKKMYRDDFRGEYVGDCAELLDRFGESFFCDYAKRKEKDDGRMD